MNNRKNNVIWIDGLNIFSIKIGFAPNKKAYKKQMKRLGLKHIKYDEPSGGRCDYITNGKESIILIVLTNDLFPHSIESIVGLIAHECVHAFDFLCESIKEKKPSKEFKCYTIQWITQGILHAVNESRFDGKLFKKESKPE